MTRRLRRFYLDAQAVLQVFVRGTLRDGSFVHVTDHWPYPADATLVSVDWAWDRQAFGLLVAHESFDEVPDGCEIPGAPYGAVSYRAVRVSDEADPCLSVPS